MRKILKGSMIAIDPSPTGTAIVHYRGDELRNYWFATKVKKWATKKYEEHAILIPDVKRGQDNERMQRLDNVFTLVKTICRSVYPEIIGMEDYVWHAPAGGEGGQNKTGGLYQMAELGGLLRLHIWKNYKGRLYDPMSVKLSRMGNGHAKKAEMIAVAYNELLVSGSSFERELRRLPQKYMENIADAMAVAELLRYELSLRNGEVSLGQLPKNIIRVMNRTTKTKKECLIDQQWLSHKHQ